MLFLFWLVDHSTGILTVLVLTALVLFIGWWRTEQRFFAIGLVVVGSLALAVVLPRLFVVTDRQQLVLNIEDMARNWEERNPDQVYAHLSEDFQRGPGENKANLMGRTRQLIRNGMVKRCRVSDFETANVSRADRTGTVTFLARGSGDWGGVSFTIRATFVFEPDGKWRLKTFKVYRPGTDPEKAEEVRLPF